MLRLQQTNGKSSPSLFLHHPRSEQRKASSPADDTIAQPRSSYRRPPFRDDHARPSHRTVANPLVFGDFWRADDRASASLLSSANAQLPGLRLSCPSFPPRPRPRPRPARARNDKASPLPRNRPSFCVIQLPRQRTRLWLLSPSLFAQDDAGREVRATSPATAGALADLVSKWADILAWGWRYRRV